MAVEAVNWTGMNVIGLKPRNVLEICDGCGKAYWLDNRYPYADYLLHTDQPMDIATAPISGEGAK